MRPRPIIIVINVSSEGASGDINEQLLTEGMEQIMAKIDEVQASFDELDAAVREFLASGGSAVDAVQAELDALRADDAVEDTKLDGLKNGIQNLKGAIDQLRPHVDNTLPEGGDEPHVEHRGA
jgi:predicted nuclease with TOPRIM domain